MLTSGSWEEQLISTMSLYLIANNIGVYYWMVANFAVFFLKIQTLYYFPYLLNLRL